MKINLNGQVIELSETELSVNEFVRLKGLNPERIVIEHNGGILENENWENTLFRDSDSVVIVSFVGGG
jgi:thiamine biosynthesis protein ThiS